MESTRSSTSVSSVLLALGGLFGVLAVCAGVLLIFLNVDFRTLLPADNGDRGLDIPAELSSANPVYGDASRVVDAFVEQVAREDATFHAETVATIEARDEARGIRLDVGTLNDSTDVAGDDFSGHSTVTSVAENFAADIVYIDGNVWLRLDAGGQWITGEYAQPVPVNPFIRLSHRGDVQYIGAETRGGAQVHHLRTTRWLGADVDALARQQNVRISDSHNVADIYVTDAGVPVSMHLVATVEMESGIETLIMQVTADYTFSQWGAPITISPPY